METNYEIENARENIRVKNNQKELQAMHYHGDKVRFVFLVMSIIMLISTPFFKNKLPMPAFISILGVLIFAMLAGLTNPKSKSVIVFNFLVSIGALLIFGREVIISYNNILTDLFFLSNLILAVLSLFALYFSSKTLRGNLLYQN